METVARQDDVQNYNESKSLLNKSLFTDTTNIFNSNTGGLGVLTFHLFPRMHLWQEINF